jgi:hypothetical protein
MLFIYVIFVLCRGCVLVFFFSLLVSLDSFNVGDWRVMMAEKMVWPLRERLGYWPVSGYGWGTYGWWGFSRVSNILFGDMECCYLGGCFRELRINEESFNCIEVCCFVPVMWNLHCLNIISLFQQFFSIHYPPIILSLSAIKYQLLIMFFNS